MPFQFRVRVSHLIKVNLETLSKFVIPGPSKICHQRVHVEYHSQFNMRWIVRKVALFQFSAMKFAISKQPCYQRSAKMSLLNSYYNHWQVNTTGTERQTPMIMWGWMWRQEDSGEGGKLHFFYVRVHSRTHSPSYARSTERDGGSGKSISNWHLIGHNEGYCSNTGYILLPCFYGIRLWILPEPFVALRWPRVRRALGTRMVRVTHVTVQSHRNLTTHQVLKNSRKETQGRKEASIQRRYYRSGKWNIYATHIWHKWSNGWWMQEIP